MAQMNFGDSNKIDKDLPENKRGEFSNKLELSRLVEAERTQVERV